MTALLSVASLVVAWVLGVLVVTTAWPRDRSLSDDAAVVVPLGLITGLGATSVLFFGASLVTVKPALASALVEMPAIVLLGWHTRVRWQQLKRIRIPGPFSRFEWLLAAAFVQAAVVAGVVAWRSYRAEPFGGWDAWAIWNMHARFMLRAAGTWPDMLALPQLSWTHPDYPRLLSGSVARVWGWAGAEAPFASALVSVSFGASVVALLGGAVAILRGRMAALAGVLLLLGTPFFVTFAANQHADIPLASFMLGAGVMTVMSRGKGAAVLAALCAAGAAWTKNDGMLFAFLFAPLAGIHFWRNGSRGTAVAFAVALAFALLPALTFKLQLAPPNDLVSSSVTSRFAQLLDPGRHAMILAALRRDAAGFGAWAVAPWVAMAFPLLAWRARRRLGSAGRLAAALPVLMLGGYYFVYLLSPHDLQWHLDTSLVRLLLQLWPLALLAWCLVLPAGSPVQSPPLVPPVRTRGAWRFVVVNGLVAIGLVAALSLQRGAGELLVRRAGYADQVSVMLDEGWYVLENYGRDEWAWSGGAARVTLHVLGDRPAGPLTVRFALRSSGARTVTVREGKAVWWEGRVGGDAVPVEITNVVLPPGTTTLEFTTDKPGVAEAAADGGRTLAFALYNFRLK